MSSKIASNIDDVHREQYERSTRKSNSSIKATSPGRNFTNTIMQYKQQISNMKTYLNELEGGFTSNGASEVDNRAPSSSKAYMSVKGHRGDSQGSKDTIDVN